MMNYTIDVIASESTVFNSYINANPYRTFKTMKNDMNSGKINDTPEQALILGKKLSPELWEHELKESAYGFVLSNGKKFFYKDIQHYDSKTKTILCRDRKASLPIKIDLENFDVFKIVKRSF